MEQKKNRPSGIRVTLAKARALAKQELGTAKGLTAAPTMPQGWFTMTLGNLDVEIYPDAVGGSGCIVLRIQLCDGTGHSVQYHDPQTLEVNFTACEKHQRDEKWRIIRQWVDENGEENCHIKLDHYRATGRW